MIYIKEGLNHFHIMVHSVAEHREVMEALRKIGKGVKSVRVLKLHSTVDKDMFIGGGEWEYA